VKARLSAAIAVAATGLAALATATAAQAAPAATSSSQAATATQWKLAYRTHGGPSQSLLAVTAPAKNDAWAAGFTATDKLVLLHWNGRSWGAASTRGFANFDPVATQSSSPSNVWLFGAEIVNNIQVPAVLVYDGTSWHMRSLPADFQTFNTAVLSSSNVWGSTTYCAGECSQLTHWNGQTWTSTTIPGSVQSAVSADGHAWFLVLTNLQFPNNGPVSGTMVLYETTGNAITKVKVPAGRFIEDGQITVAPNGQRWLLTALATKGNAHPMRLYHWAGNAWTLMSIPANMCPPGETGFCPWGFSELTYDGKNGFWAGWQAHWTGTRWLDTNNFAAQIRSSAAESGVLAVIPGTGSVWGVGAISRAGTGTDSMVIVYGPLP
jgi:hypothetical protein